MRAAALVLGVLIVRHWLVRCAVRAIEACVPEFVAAQCARRRRRAAAREAWWSRRARAEREHRLEARWGVGLLLVLLPLLAVRMLS